MDDNFEWSRGTLTISIDGDVVTCVVGDGTTFETLSVRDGSQVASLLRAPTRQQGEDAEPPAGVRAATAPARPRNEFDVDVFPRFTEVEPRTDRARFRVEATRLFEDVANDVETALRDRFRTTTGEESQHDRVNGLLENINVSLPGVYDDGDVQDVETSLEAAGFGVQTTVRAPMGTALHHLQSVTEPSTIVAVELGGYWCSAAIVEVDPDVRNVHVVARVTAPDLGRRAMDRALAEWVLAEEQAETNVSITARPAAFQRVRAAAHEVLEAEGHAGTVDVSDLHDVELDTGTPPIDIDRPIESTLPAFESINERLCELFDQLLAAGDLDRAEIDSVVVAGSGSIPAGIDEIIEGYWERPIARAVGDVNPRSVPASGASTVARNEPAAESALDRRETVFRSIEVSIPTADGDASVTVVPALTPVGETRQVRLRTTAENQLRGRFRLVSTHQATGDRTEIGTYKVEPLPSGAAAGELVLDILITPTSNSLDAETVDVEARFPDDVLDERISADPRVTAVTAATNPARWLLPEAVDGDDVDVPEADAQPATVVDDPIAETLDEASPKAVLDTILNVRYQIWKALQSEDPLDPSDLGELLKLFDMGLTKMNVDVIAPELRAQRDRERHRVWDTEPASNPDGEILSVHKPGFTIDGHVETPADIIVSKGTPSSESDNEGDTDEVGGSKRNTEANNDTDIAQDSDESAGSNGDDDSGDGTEHLEGDNASTDHIDSDNHGDSDASDTSDDESAEDLDGVEEGSSQRTTPSEPTVLELDITATPSKVAPKNVVTFTVTDESGTPVEDAELKFTGDTLGQTDEEGVLQVVFKKKGKHTLTATKSNPGGAYEYVDATVSVLCSDSFEG